MGQLYIKEIVLDSDSVVDSSSFPFSLPAIKALKSLSFNPVTFFVGENGMGKSILLESIAIKLGCIAIEAANSQLYQNIKIGKTNTNPDACFYLPDAYQCAKQNQPKQHGEGFMTLLTQKLQGNGLYLFDEPEASLSPSRQLNALIAIHKLVKNNSQIIMATQSPVLLAYPNAKIYKLHKEGINEVWFENTDPYRIMKETMNYPDEMMKVILK